MSNWHVYRYRNLINDMLRVGFSKLPYFPKKPKKEMSVSCEIYFHFDVIYPGQTITGEIAVSAIKNPCVVEQIIMEVVGLAECKWSYNKHLIKPPKIYRKGTFFSGKEQFFFSRHGLAGDEAGDIGLNETSINFPFLTSLPEHSPATWTGQYGKIKYTAKVIIKERTKPLQSFTKQVNVGTRRDLTLEQHLLCEARQDIHRTFRYAIISLGNVNVSIWLPLCGIAAGQAVPLLCTIVNESTVQFGGVIFILTQVEIYRSKQPTTAAKTYRKDICRVPRMVDILQGKYEYYCLLQTEPHTFPTTQYWRNKTCQVTYEVWVSLQGSIPRYSGYGYPNIDTPGIPLIIGTKPLCEWDSQAVTNEVMSAVYNAHPQIIMEPLPPDDDIEEMLNNADEELDPETECNLARQLTDEPMFQIIDDDDASVEMNTTVEENEKSLSNNTQI